jgi:Glycosyl transferase family 64 domain
MRSDLKTAAIFSLDDDVRVDHSGLEKAFRTWQQYPNHQIGFMFVARGAQYNSTTDSWEYKNHNPERIEIYRPPHCSLAERENDM